MIAFVGLSHLGIVSSIAAAAKGFEVLGHDADAALCERLARGQLPVLEPGLPELLAGAGTPIRFTSDLAALAACDVIVVSGDVPTDTANRSNLSGLQATLEEVALHASPCTTVVVLSQVHPGFTRAAAAGLAQRHAAKALDVLYQVETLIFGRAVERAMAPERIVIGAADPAAPLPPAYARLVAAFECPVFRVRYESAELAKIAINMCLAASVTVANTLAELCEGIGADWSEIVPALRADGRIGPHAYLAAGLGLAGGNLERDLVTMRSLASEFGTDAGIVAAWTANSSYRKDWPLTVLHRYVFPTTKAPTIAVWGLAYKAHTRSVKNSPALELLAGLRDVAVTVYDPEVALDGAAAPRARACASALEACAGADALVIMTPWPEFATVAASALADTMRGRTIVDPFGVLSESACLEAGFTYVRLGAPAAHPRGGRA